jgi:hypothetical protein
LHQSDSIQCVGKRLVPYEYKNTEKPWEVLHKWVLCIKKGTKE